MEKCTYTELSRRCDIILQTYYITRGHKSIMYRYEQYKRTLMSCKGIPRAGRERLKGTGAATSQPALAWSSMEGSMSSQAPKLDMQVQGSQKATQRVIK